ncbi:far upstream element-binding protein 1-like isoform X2 [Argiope bruennichi]|nr:far upstream element-binding protein 1-like isoform X2 [Argiope bruennichi]
MYERNETGGNFVEEQFLVPDKMAGKIIGLCGEQIHRIETKTGCKAQLDPRSDDNFYRICTLTGSQESVKAGKSMIKQIISEYSSNSFQSGYVPDGQIVTEMMIPGLKVALLIGKGGEKIKNLQEQCGAKMAFIQDGPEHSIYDKPLRIWGDAENVKIAEQMVTDFLAQNETFSVPIDKCGHVIGKGGKTIRSIAQQSGASIKKAKELPSYTNEQTFIIRGTPKQIKHAKKLIREIIPDQMVTGFFGQNKTIADQMVTGFLAQNETMNSDQGDYNFLWAVVFWLLVVFFVCSFIKSKF